MSKQKLQQKQYQNLSPQQIQFLGLLQIPIVALEKRIEEELEDNPALEEEEEPLSLAEKNNNYTPKNTDFQYQIEDKAESLSDHLHQQLVTFDLEEETQFLVRYLINSLDDNGFLDRDLHAISSDLLINSNLDISELKLSEALTVLQQLEPYGVGAKNLQEGLLIQLQILYPKKTIEQELISNYYKPFSNKNFEHLTKHLEISLDELKAAYKLIESLNPIPAAGFSKESSITDYIYPDFTISIHEGEAELQLNKSNVKPISVSKYYQNMLKETKDASTQQFLSEKVAKAKWFKEAIEKRNNTLKNVMSVILDIQKPYFLTGEDKDLKPMKLGDIAQVVNMDISTISRVSNAKYVATHFGTFKLKELFSEAYKKENGELISTKEIKSKLIKIIETEDKISPFNDEQLAELLGKEKYHIARRTVAKYREDLGIQSSKLRRSL